MIKYIVGLLSIITSIQSNSIQTSECIQFTVGTGTGCEWMCNYCANELGTDNYYFTDGVCNYEAGGCVGNPIAGKLYTCCEV
jgi:hypothetical protein